MVKNHQYLYAGASKCLVTRVSNVRQLYNRLLCTYKQKLFLPRSEKAIPSPLQLFLGGSDFEGKEISCSISMSSLLRPRLVPSCHCFPHKYQRQGVHPSLPEPKISFVWLLTNPIVRGWTPPQLAGLCKNTPKARQRL